MKNIYLPDDSLTQDIVALLAASSLSEREKKGWLATLGDMNEDDKKELKSNLEEQLALDMDMAKDAVTDFVRILDTTF